jgi:hypothetical protein
MLSTQMKRRLLESSLFDRIGESFVTSDRVHTLFALQILVAGSLALEVLPLLGSACNRRR